MKSKLAGLMTIAVLTVVGNAWALNRSLTGIWNTPPGDNWGISDIGARASLVAISAEESVVVPLAVPLNLLNQSISGVWTTPAGEPVTLQHDLAKKTLQLQWRFSSRATGPVILRGKGTVEEDELDMKLFANINIFPLIIGNKTCPCRSITFSSTAQQDLGEFLMSNCAIDFTYKCADEPVTTVSNICNGRWL